MDISYYPGIQQLTIPLEEIRFLADIYLKGGGHFQQGPGLLKPLFEPQQGPSVQPQCVILWHDHTLFCTEMVLLMDPEENHPRIMRVMVYRNSLWLHLYEQCESHTLSFFAEQFEQIRGKCPESTAQLVPPPLLNRLQPVNRPDWDKIRGFFDQKFDGLGTGRLADVLPFLVYDPDSLFSENFSTDAPCLLQDAQSGPWTPPSPPPNPQPSYCFDVDTSHMDLSGDIREEYMAKAGDLVVDEVLPPGPKGRQPSYTQAPLINLTPPPTPQSYYFNMTPIDFTRDMNDNHMAEAKVKVIVDEVAPRGPVVQPFPSIQPPFTDLTPLMNPMVSYFDAGITPVNFTSSMSGQYIAEASEVVVDEVAPQGPVVQPFPSIQTPFTDPTLLIDLQLSCFSAGMTHVDFTGCRGGPYTAETDEVAVEVVSPQVLTMAEKPQHNWGGDERTQIVPSPLCASAEQSSDPSPTPNPQLCDTNGPIGDQAMVEADEELFDGGLPQTSILSLKRPHDGNDDGEARAAPYLRPGADKPRYVATLSHIPLADPSQAPNPQLCDTNEPTSGQAMVEVGEELVDGGLPQTSILSLKRPHDGNDDRETRAAPYLRPGVDKPRYVADSKFLCMLQTLSFFVMHHKCLPYVFSHSIDKGKGIDRSQHPGMFPPEPPKEPKPTPSFASVGGRRVRLEASAPRPYPGMYPPEPPKPYPGMYPPGPPKAPEPKPKPTQSSAGFGGPQGPPNQTPRRSNKRAPPSPSFAGFGSPQGPSGTVSHCYRIDDRAPTPAEFLNMQAAGGPPVPYSPSAPITPFRHTPMSREEVLLVMAAYPTMDNAGAIGGTEVGEVAVGDAVATAAKNISDGPCILDIFHGICMADHDST
ncbi:hypothetical protein N7495_003290 [Penicillium taxi]|uniref:uncharacterized protein n=1 Tax=Penicillium taxi TaxID=168475 RepID=UPI0025456688|nr:uncharacterized protein N7495_003290 [Penicillium taxi]KAJ5902762.1 hypothetical protein N7495_003290 [Penicillium taxi]